MIARKLGLRNVRLSDVSSQVAQRHEAFRTNLALEVVGIFVEVEVIDEC